MLDLPLGLWGLEALRRVAPPVVVNASWLAPRVAAALGGPDIEVSVEHPEPYGTGGTLKALEGRIADRIVVHNCDLLTALDPADLLATHEASGAIATIAVRDVNHGADLMHDGRRATRFVDRRHESTPGAVYMGMAVLGEAAVSKLEDRRPLGLGETLLRSLANDGELAVHRHLGYSTDVGTPESYLHASLDLLEGRAPPPPRAYPGRFVEVLGGKAYLGPNATAAPGTLGPSAIVLAGATVEARARVKHAIVWPGATIKSGREVRGAIALDDRDLI
jgi:mannose-1-phosphate guanylyltransferase